MENKTEVFNVYNDKNILEYIIKVYSNDEGQVYELLSSNEQHWFENCRNKTLLTITDDGDGIEWFGDNYNNKLDYSEFIELYILMSFVKNKEKGFIGYEIKSETFLKL